MNDVQIVRRWNQRFLHLFWFALGLYIILSTIAAFLHTNPERQVLLIGTVLRPALFLLLLIGALQIAARQFPQRLPVFLVLGTYIAVYIVADALSSLISPLALLVIPMMFSTIYLRRHLVLISSGASLLEFGFLYFDLYRPQHIISSMDLLVFVGVLIIAASVAFVIVGRGRELTQSLVQSVEARQELMMQNVWMQRMSKFDALTELYNRSAFQDHVTRLVEVCNKHDIPLHLAVIDIDDFKLINDTYGHNVGDKVLKEFAAHLMTLFHDEFFVARYGGEEFVVVGTEVQESEFIQHLERVRSETSTAKFAGHAITVSIGIHTCRKGESADVLFQLADKGLYWSKNHGKNQIGFGLRNPGDANQPREQLAGQEEVHFI